VTDAPAAVAGAIVEADAVSKDYGGRRVVRDVTFTLRRAECLGLLGPNGAGKTTTIRMITCFTAPTAGALTVLGRPVVAGNHAAIKTRLGIVQQEESLDPDLSVEKNLLVFASYFGIPRRTAAERTDALVRFAALAEHRTARIGTLSGGMRRRLMLARALLNDPALLVLDEPTTGLDPQARRLVWERIRSLKRQGTTILLTTHYMDEAAELCDRVLIMDDGRIIAEGPPDALVASHVGSEVIAVYVGDAPAAMRPALDRLAHGPWRTEHVGDVLYIYLRDTDFPTGLLAALDGVAITRRGATLEDVFLTLTGHALRD